MKQKGFLNINIIILVALILMLSYWLIAAPKVDILKTVQDLPKLTVQKITSQADQASKVAQKPVVDQNAASKLSTKQINNLSDLDKIGRDLDSTDVDSVDKSINQIETDVE